MSRPVAVPTLLERVLVDFVVVATPDGRCLTFAGTGPMIWCLIDGSRSIEEISGELAEMCAADEAVVRSDVERFVDELRAWGALIVEDD